MAELSKRDNAAPRFDWQAALDGLHMIEHSRHLFNDMQLALVGARLDDAVAYDASLKLYGLAVDVLTKCRSLDEWCRGIEGGVAVPEYIDGMVDWHYDPGTGRSKRTTTPSQIADGLAGARFVANKSLHMFATIARGMPVWIAPGGMASARFGLLVWHRVEQVPPSLLTRPADPAGLTAYGRVMAGNKVEHTLNWLCDHFRRWLVERPRRDRRRVP